MITFAEAQAIVMATVQVLDREQVPLDEACGRVLAADIAADADQPPFDKSAMDGFACRSADLPGPLRVIETIAAGSTPSLAVAAGLCSRIMTGAPVPSGADCVVKFEDTETLADGTVRCRDGKPGGNICVRGEDVRRGDTVLGRGTCLGPPHIAVLATVGCAEVPVVRRPRVGIMATGDELVTVDQQPGPGQIRNSNGPQLEAQIRSAGAVPVRLGTVRDDTEALTRALQAAMADCDVVLLSGGVSTGDFDLVPPVMRDCGLEIRFDSIAMKPGRPTTFAVAPGLWCFGLPGNPVSTFVQFEILVRPLLTSLMGGSIRPLAVTAPLAETITRRKSSRQAWLPVRLTGSGEAQLVEYHGSAHIHAMCRADGLIHLPIGTTTLEQGALVEVRLLAARP
jgi:molybdopterin molybdotransferase